MFTICFYFHPQSIWVQRNLFNILFLFSFLHPWRIDQLLWSILLLVLNINWINLFANFAAFVLVGHTTVLNLFSKDNCGNEGIMDPNFSKKLFLSFENRGHWTKKWNSSSTGLGGWGAWDPKLQYWHVLWCIGVTGVLNLPVSIPKKWLLTLNLFCHGGGSNWTTLFLSQTARPKWLNFFDFSCLSID